MKILRDLSIFYLLTFFLQFPNSLHASGAAAFGGFNSQGSESQYSIYYNPDGNSAESIPITTVSEGRINSTSINVNGNVILGGYTGLLPNTFPFIEAFVDERTQRPIGDLPTGQGAIKSVAVNSQAVSFGVVGGVHQGNKPYAALMALGTSQSQLVQFGGAIPQGTGSIDTVSIGGKNSGIIAGIELGNQPYAAKFALVSLQKITGSILADGAIKSVAINDKETGLMGGVSGGGVPYLTRVLGTTASNIDIQAGGNGSINTVALNNSGIGIVGGEVNNKLYAGYVYSLNSSFTQSSATTFKDLPNAQGAINTVAINDNGSVIIGGHIGTMPYAALSYLEEDDIELFPVEVPSGSGVVNSVAISQEGVAFIGGQVNGSGFVRLIAPNGDATEIPELPSFPGDILSVASVFFEEIVPESVGAGNTYTDSLFVLSTQMSSNRNMGETSISVPMANQVGLLADASDVIMGNIPCAEKSNYALWMSPFGVYSHQKKQQRFASSTNWGGGVLLGFDYKGIENMQIGVGAAYAYNRVKVSEDRGHSNTHQELLTFYFSWWKERLMIQAALWGGPYQTHNTRTTLGFLTAKANINGWLLSPHFELSFPFYVKGDWFILEPLAMFDWANNWQDSFREHGDSGFNIHLGHQYTSLLRSEVGFRFYESIHFKWGDILFMEKGSYVNKKPFHTGMQSTSFIGSPSTFAIEVFSSKVQNLGVVRIDTKFIPCKNRYPYGSISYQGEFGSSFQLHFLSIEIGKRF